MVVLAPVGWTESDVLDEIVFGFRVFECLRVEEAHGADSVVLDWYDNVMSVWG